MCEISYLNLHLISSKQLIKIVIMMDLFALQFSNICNISFMLIMFIRKFQLRLSCNLMISFSEKSVQCRKCLCELFL